MSDTGKVKNLETWNQFNRPPREALKTIKGGRLAGMSDINPQWRLKAMTEAFGPCGKGWWYTIDKLWTEPGPEGQTMAFAQILLTVDGHLAAIPGIGGSAMVAQEKGGLRANDECYKMAVTDALSVAMKALGVAADVYMGLWDGTKYSEAPTAPHSGSSDVLEHLEADQLTVVKDTAEEVKALMSKGEIIKAFDWLAAANFDADSKVACWSLLPSHYRTALTKEGDGRKTIRTLKDAKNA
jgi:hypothetical protein